MGKSLAIRFLASLVVALDFREGEEVKIYLVGEKHFYISKKTKFNKFFTWL